MKKIWSIINLSWKKTLTLDEKQKKSYVAHKEEKTKNINFSKLRGRTSAKIIEIFNSHKSLLAQIFSRTHKRIKSCYAKIYTQKTGIFTISFHEHFIKHEVDLFVKSKIEGIV